MTKRKGAIAVLFIILLLFPTGCKNKNLKTIDFGALDNYTYTNKYFNMTMQLPEDWILQSDKRSKNTLNTSEANNVDLPNEKSLTLIGAFKYSVVGEPEFNPSFISIADKITKEFKVQNGMEYLKGVKDSLIATQLPYEFSKDIYVEQIANKDFYVLEAAINVDDFHVNQKSYATVIDKYILVFTFSYSNDAEYNELNNVIKSIKFE